MNISVLELNNAEVPLEDGCFFLNENKQYHLALDAAFDARAWLGARRLIEVEKGKFLIDIGYWVGESELRVEASGKQLNQIPVFVRPSAEKLAESNWFTMLREIEAWLPTSFLGGEGGGIGHVGSTGTSAALLSEALVPLLPVLEKALKVMLDHPRQLDRGIWIEQNFAKIRGVGREVTTWLARHPFAAEWLDPWKATELVGHGPKIPVRTSFDSVDHPANQYIAWLLDRILKKLEDIRNILILIGKSQSANEDTSSWCNARIDRIDRWLFRIRRVIRNSFIARIKKKPASESALLTILDDPVYARIHAMGRLFLSPLFKLGESPDNHKAAIKPSYTIYELWCFLAIFRLLETYLEDWTWKSKGLGNLLSLTGSGEGAEITAMYPCTQAELKILFNPTFASYYYRNDKARWSLSAERRPDIVITLSTSANKSSWLFCDAKYRVGKRNLEDAFDSIHSYRDSLRYDYFGGKCQAGCLLSPSASGAEKWFSKDFRDEYLTGIWELRPGKKHGTEMAAWMMETLQYK